MTARARKALDEPSAINRLLISPVTESWSRTLRAIVVLLALAVLAVATASGAALLGPSIADSLQKLVGEATGGS